MKKYTHFENEIFDNGQPDFGKFMIQMIVVAIIALLALILI